MSHELRTPLNAIIGFAELMRRELFGRLGAPRYREYADDIHNSGTHLLAVINDVLDLSKAEAGKTELQESVVDVAVAVEAARRLVAVRADSSGIALSVEGLRAVPPLRADERMLKQMLLNLLTNAIKFTPRGGSVEIGAARSRDGAIHIWVTDTGTGLSHEEIPRILEPYGRSDVARIQNAEGTGLGLPLVKAMIEAHGGRLDIVSAKGEGSTFTLRFPAERCIERAQAA
jgi:signal transduction histidine kinase